METNYNNDSRKSSNGFYKGFFWTTLALLVAGVFMFLYKRDQDNRANNTYPPSYNQPVSLIDRYPPSKYLTIQSTGLSDIFWALRLNGTIENHSPITYKDAVIQINFYSETGSIIGQKDYTIYNFFAPGTSQDFKIEERQKDLRHCDHIDYSVVSANAVNE